MIVGTLVSLGCLYVALRDVSWPEAARALGRARWGYALAAAVVGLLGIVVRALRWGLMLRSLRRFPLASLLSASMIGSLVNNVMPARAGDLARAYVLARREQFSAMSAIAGVAYGRVLDVFATLVLLALAMLQPAAPRWTRSVGLALVVANTIALALLILSLRHEQRARRLLTRIVAPLSHRLSDRLDEALSSLIEGLRASMARRMTIQILLSTFALMLCVVGAVYLSLPALGLPASASAAILTTAAVSFASMIPASPGNVGTIQYACLVALAVYGVSPTDAAAFSLLYHATQYLPPTLLGALFLWHEHLRLSVVGTPPNTEPPR